MDLFFQAISWYRRRKYDECIEVCNQLMTINGDRHHQGAWELKMRAMTQRVYIDDIEVEDGIPEQNDLDTNLLATAPRPGTSFRTATALEINLGTINNIGGRPRTTTGRPLTGMSRPGTVSQRPGSSMRTRTALRTTGGGTRTGSAAHNIRVGSAAMFALGDPNGPLLQTSKLNPNKFINEHFISKSLFQFLYYHEGDLRKALELCEVICNNNDNNNNNKVSTIIDDESYANNYNHNKINKNLWWWHAQRGRCYLFMGNPRAAESHLRLAFNQFAHPDTALLLARVYVKIDQPLAAIESLDNALKRLPDEITLLTHQARILELLGNLQASVQQYRRIVQQETIHPEALASIAVHHFYGNQPEIALIYYRRILSMGAHSCELYCNIALCCLYGGQLDLVLPCFQRAIRLSTSPEQRADVWYNISFVALTCGDFNLARRCLRLCISSDGSHGAALNNLAVLATRYGQHSKAKSYLSAAKNVLPDSDEIEHNLKLIDNI